jgi:drug/metabolite transporter (DMT)-like permease
VWQACLTTLLFSVSAVCGQRSARLLGGVEANFWRVWVAVLMLGLWAHTLGHGLAGKSLPIFFLSGLVGFGLGDVSLYQALPRIGARLSILLVHCVAAPFAAVVEWLWLGTPLSVAQILAGLTILAGVALALAPSRHLEMSRGTLWAGVAFAIVAALGQGGGAVLTRKAVEVARAAGEQPVDGLTAAYQRILGGVLVGTIVFCFLKWRQAQQGNASDLPVGRRAAGVRWIVANAMAGSVLGVGAFQWALMLQPTGVVLPIVALTPLVIIPFSIYIEGERPTRRSLVGGVIAVVGVVALTLAR